MLTNTTNGTANLARRVATRRLVTIKQKPLQVNGPLGDSVAWLSLTLAGPAATAANGEQFCTHGGQKPEKGDLVACYSDAGCRFAGSRGAEPVRGYDQSSAPFALARGKITGIVTSSAGLIAQIKKVGGACRRL